MNQSTRLARASNVSNLVLEQNHQSLGLRWGVVLSRSGDTRRINIETAEGEVIKDVVGVFWSDLVDYPAPPQGTVVLWGFADGLAEQPFYLGVVRPDEWTPKQSGEIRLTGSLIKLDSANKALVNEAPIMVIGGKDTDGDTMIDDGQPNQQP